VRLSGAESAVAAARRKLGGSEVPGAEGWWQELREQRLPFFAAGRALWRVSVPQTAQPLALGSMPLIEWGGGLRWFVGDLDAGPVRAAAAGAGGHATLFRNGDKSPGVFQPLAPALMKIHRRLKSAFDPEGILNPRRMYDF
jgi:glycolate oxidase FAD binding subunit